MSEELYDRLPLRERERAGQEHLDETAADVERHWLRGFTPAQIGNELGLSVRRVYQIIEPFRELLEAGEYDAELAKLAAQGFTNLPVKGQSGKGRRRVPLTDVERQVQADHVTLKLGRRALAKKYDLTVDRVRYILQKRE